MGNYSSPSLGSGLNPNAMGMGKTSGLPLGMENYSPPSFVSGFTNSTSGKSSLLGFSPSSTSNLSSYNRSTLDSMATGLGAFAFANGSKTGLLDFSIRSQFNITSKEFNNLSSFQKNAKTMRAMGSRFGFAYTKTFKGLGVTAFITSTGISAYQLNQAWTNSDPSFSAIFAKTVLDVGMSAFGTFGGAWGFAISSGYFLLDAGGALGTWGKPTKGYY